MQWQEFVALLTLATATSFTPGPNTTLSTTLAANFGLKRALRFVLAVPVGWGLLLSACAAGLGAVIVAMPLLRIAIKAWMLALTVVAGWIAGTSDAAQRFALVLPVMLFFGLASNFTYALTGSLLRGWLAVGRRLLMFNRVMAVLLVLTAAWMASV